MSAFGKIVGVFFIFLIAIVAVVGIMALFGKTSTTPFVDSYNGTTTNVSNSTQDLTAKTVSTGSQVGVGIIFIIGALLVIAVIMGGIYIIFR